MSEFVDQCRAEWRRLGVPDAITNEMAADLAADLDEAAADGLSPEDVLGTSAFDPRAFAASWARERGVVPTAPVAASRARSLAPPRPLRLVVSVTAIVGALALFAAALAFVFDARHGRSVAVRPAPDLLSRDPIEMAHQAAWLNPASVIALFAVVMIGVGLTALAWWAWRRGQPPTTPA